MLCIVERRVGIVVRCDDFDFISGKNLIKSRFQMLLKNLGIRNNLIEVDISTLSGEFHVSLGRIWQYDDPAQCAEMLLEPERNRIISCPLLRLHGGHTR